MAAEAAALAREERRQDRLRRGGAARDVRDRERDRPLRQAEDRRVLEGTGEGLYGGVERRRVGGGAVGPEAGDRAADEARVAGAQRLGGETEALHHAGTEI